MDPASYTVHVSQFTFPDHQNMPSGFLEFGYVPSVPLYVPSEFRVPVVLPSARKRCCAAPRIGMLMPEAAVDKDDLQAPWKNEIRAARQILAVQAKSVAKLVSKPPYDKLWLRIAATDG